MQRDISSGDDFFGPRELPGIATIALQKRINQSFGFVSMTEIRFHCQESRAEKNPIVARGP